MKDIWMQPPLPTTTTTTTTTMTNKRKIKKEKKTTAATTAFSIFPRASTTLITCASNSGKTWFLRQALLNRRVFIEAGETIQRVVYINCNQRDAQFSHPWETEEVQDDEDDDDDNGGGGGSNYDDDDDDNDKDSENYGRFENNNDDDDDGGGGGKDDDDDDDDSDTIELISIGMHELAAAAAAAAAAAGSGDNQGDLLGLISPGDVVILDDLQTLTKPVEHLINYGAHHYQLVVFVVTQSCLGSPLYALIKAVHNVVLLFANNSVSNLARHIQTRFFLCQDTRDYLGRIYASAEKNKSTVVLKLNSVATSNIHRSVLAFSGVEGLYTDDAAAAAAAAADTTEAVGCAGRAPYPPAVTTKTTRLCTVFPEAKYREDMMQETRRRKIRLSRKTSAGLASADEAFVLVPLQNVQEMDDEDDDDGDDDDDDDNDDPDYNDGDGTGPAGEKRKKKKKKICLRRQWDEMNEALESEIEAAFQFAKWNVAKNLMREILKCPHVCISSDFRLAHTHGKDFSIIDFLQVATRQAGPNEGEGGRRSGDRRKNNRENFVLSFVPLLAVLLANRAPVSYIKNKHLLNLALKYKVRTLSSSARTGRKRARFASAAATTTPTAQ